MPTLMEYLSTLEHVERVSWAQDLARRLLSNTLPRRWAHTQGVGHKAESIARIVGDDAETLICAAWLHDIGYAPPAVRTGLHQLDGARFLRDSEKAESWLCRLVAHHSYAIAEARNRGLANELQGEFPAVRGLTADALTYCDMTTDPSGGPVSVDVRLDEILVRYKAGDIVHTSIRQARQDIAEAVSRVSATIGTLQSPGPG